MDETKESLLSGYTYYQARDSVENEVGQASKHILIRYRYTRSKGVWYMVIFSIATFILATIFYAVGLRTHPRSTISQRERKSCGNTTEQARVNGCILDFIPGAWVHPDCYDEELEKEFLGIADWHWYSDTNGQHELSQDFIR
ncbi:hypothetical protein F5884DRAFT_448130 [Xylogone sp. PMI_703]|nr:hypothetical protein F5884DRAFT_448130 [Xylogone sp. PMI_703]